MNTEFDLSCSSSSSPWARILGVLVDRGRSREALALFRQMHLEGIVLERRMFLALANAAAAGRDLEQARLIHRCARESGAEAQQDSLLATAIVNMYGKCGDYRAARLAFDAIADPGVVSWTALISALSESPDDAIHLFRLMQLQGVAPNAVTILAILASCCDLRVGISIHALYDESRSRTRSRSEGEEIDLVVTTAMVAMYGRVGSVAMAQALFHGMPEKSIVTWNTMIAAYAQNRHSLESLVTYRQMLLDGQHMPSKVTFLAVIQACGSPQLLAHGRSIHTQSMERGVSCDAAVATTLVTMYGKCGGLAEARDAFAAMEHRDTACWTAMIGACAENGDASSGVFLFRRMELEGIRAGKITLVALLTACAADSSCLGAGREIHRRATELGLVSDAVVANALLSMYGKAGKLREAWAIFIAISRSASSPASSILVAWNSMIAAFALYRDPGETLELFQRMLLEGVEADGRTLMGVLDGCTHRGRVEQGCYFFALMGDLWIAPEKEHFGCLADLLGRAGWLREAEELIRRMPAAIGDDFKWMSLLGACKMHGDVERAARAAQRAVEIDSRNSAAAYVALSTLYKP